MPVASDFLPPAPMLVALLVSLPVRLPKALFPPSTAVGVGAGTVRLLVVELPLEDADAVVELGVEGAVPTCMAFIALYGWPV